MMMVRVTSFLKLVMCNAYEKRGRGDGEQCGNEGGVDLHPVNCIQRSSGQFLEGWLFWD
jgi:hypothetical protein